MLGEKNKPGKSLQMKEKMRKATEVRHRKPNIIMGMKLGLVDRIDGAMLVTVTSAATGVMHTEENKIHFLSAWKVL